MSDSVRERLGKLFDVGAPQTAQATEPTPGELFRGTGWVVSQGPAGLQLHYVSGEVGGRDKVVSISPDEAAALRKDEGRLNDILIAHGAG